MIRKKVVRILKEIDYVLKDVDDFQVRLFIDEIQKSNNIVLCGAGRVGLAAKGFAMRLGHLGLNAYCVGDSTTPNLSKKDLLIACSGSGETQTTYDILKKAKDTNAKTVLISSYIEHHKSRMAKLADVMVVINAPTKQKAIRGFVSRQPMTTLNEQCLQIFFDSVVLLLMEELREKNDTMQKRHTTLE